MLGLAVSQALCDSNQFKASNLTSKVCFEISEDKHSHQHHFRKITTEIAKRFDGLQSSLAAILTASKSQSKVENSTICCWRSLQHELENYSEIHEIDQFAEDAFTQIAIASVTAQFIANSTQEWKLFGGNHKCLSQVPQHNSRQNTERSLFKFNV